jgi:hypothetical protein
MFDGQQEDSNTVQDRWSGLFNLTVAEQSADLPPGIPWIGGDGLPADSIPVRINFPADSRFSLVPADLLF